MTIDEMIAEENQLLGANQLLNALSKSVVFSEEVQQLIRIEGLKYVSAPRQTNKKAA